MVNIKKEKEKIQNRINYYLIKLKENYKIVNNYAKSVKFCCSG
jgi:hypothetical protein